ncbi:MAG: acetate--CoA ligase family protein [Anaerolineales bacterium]|nr:acetate--CoA ligase family protein [Anaerolineales bacterium]
MKDFFYPESVAVIGVSSKSNNLGRNIVANLIEFGFDGIVYAVGPNGGVIETRMIYPTVKDIPGPVDLAVILTPSATVPSILKECGEKGIYRVVIETAGFREYGNKGRILEADMIRVANEYGIRFVGPNCIGAINMENGFCVPFPRLKKFIKQGSVSIITQSGGVGMSALNIMADNGIGLNKFVSVGNMLNVDAEEMLAYLLNDEGTDIIFLYLESIRDGRRLMEIARKSSKPILTFKSNIGEFGQSIAASHTASLSSNDKVVEAAFQQAGIIRIHDATSFANSLNISRLAPMRGKNLAIISRSGGHAVIAADACELSGLNLAPLPPSFLREIEKHFRASVIKLTNPLDLGDLFDLEVYGQIVEQTLRLESVDGLIFLHTSLSEAEHQASRLLVERLNALSKQIDKPVAFYISTSAEELNYLRQNYDFPVFTRVVETIRALEMSYRHYCQIERVQAREKAPTFTADRPAVKKLIEKAKKASRDLLLSESMEVLDHYGIHQAPWAAASTLEQARKAAGDLGYPVAIKVIAENISHKSDIGGVRLNLKDEQALTDAYNDLMNRLYQADPHSPVEGVMVQPMVTGGVELIVGGRQDKQFGPVVLVGMGGIFVEIIKEVVVRVAPISRLEAIAMIENLRGASVLQGARGRQRSDIESVGETLLRLAQLFCDFPEIQEVDINPLMVFDQQGGCCALDARVIL